MCGRLADPITYRCAAAPFGPGHRDSPRSWCWSGSTLSERSGESPQSLPDVVAGDAIDPFRKPLSESPRHGRGGEVDGYHVLRYGTEHTDPVRAVLVTVALAGSGTSTEDAPASAEPASRASRRLSSATGTVWSVDSTAR